MAIYTKNKTYKKKKSRKFPLLVLLAVLIVAGVGSGVWWRHNHTKPTRTVLNNGSVAVSDPNVPGAKDNGSSSGGADSPETNSKDSPNNSSAPSVDASVQPNMPGGQYVSDYNPSLSGKDGRNRENSVCQTTPGVQCEIRFTMGSVVKTLPAQKTNASGATSWDWNIKERGLTQGTWKVTAVAINGTKTVRVDDANQLVVRP